MALAPMVIVAIALTLYFQVLRYGDVEEGLVQRGATLARQLVPAAEYGMFAGNRTELGRLALTIALEPDVSSISFFDSQGTLLASVGTPLGDINPLSSADGATGEAADGRVLYFHAKVKRNVQGFDDPFVDPEKEPRTPRTLGSLTVELSRDRLIKRKREMLAFTLLVVAGLTAAVALLAQRLGRSLTEPILALREAVHRIREGRLSTRVAIHPAETLRDLEEGINAMAASLEAARNRSAAALASSEAELRKQYDFAETLLRAHADAGVGVVILDGRKVVYANSAFEAIQGYSQEELRNLDDIAQLAVADDGPVIDHLLAQAGAGIGERGELTILRKDGTRAFLETTVMPMQSGEGPSRVIGVALDVSQRKLDAEKISATNAELQRQRDEAERANQAKSRFLAAASHDLRQPLHALNLFGAEMEARASTADLHRLSQQINTAIGSMGELLDAMLDVSRLDFAELAPRLQPVALAPLLESAAQAHTHSAHARGLGLKVRPTDLWVESDPAYLGRILNNLVGTAVRYTGKGRVLIGVRRRGNLASIEVWDTGIGIAGEHLDQVFQEFYQVANPERDAGKGLGLGLAIVRRLAEALGHRIEVRSRPGKGSVFSVAAGLASPIASPTVAEPHGAFGIRIMALGGNRQERASLAALLRGWGCRVAEAGDADAAGLVMAAGTPALVIVDASSLGLYSATVAQAAPSVPIIVIGSPPPDWGAGLAAECHRLTKPLRPARLRALLNHLLADSTA